MIHGDPRSTKGSPSLHPTPPRVNRWGPRTSFPDVRVSTPHTFVRGCQATRLNHLNARKRRAAARSTPAQTTCGSAPPAQVNEVARFDQKLLL